MAEVPATTTATTATPSSSTVSNTPEQRGPCCWFLATGHCDPPRPPCRFRHQPDDGHVVCCFGATCRLGHADRALPPGASIHEKLAYWDRYNSNNNQKGDGSTATPVATKAIRDTASHQSVARVGKSPADRDATLLRSQLEPWPTAVLRQRLTLPELGGFDHRTLDPLNRGEIMDMLLRAYRQHCDGRRQVMDVTDAGTEVPAGLRDELLEELQAWRHQHQHINTRPSISATAYMILRSPVEFRNETGDTDVTGPSRRAVSAAKKLAEYQQLWHVAYRALRHVDPDYASTFSALAVTYGFRGSPHIDKQNTGPFYGLSLGTFSAEEGGICVEVDPFRVAHVQTKNCLVKIDGRFPHWVAPYDTSQGQERYSLIYYSTRQTYEPPVRAYFPKPSGHQVAAVDAKSEVENEFVTVPQAPTSLYSSAEITI